MPQAPISVVIPTLDAESGLLDAAGSLVPGLAAGLVAELVVSDGGSSDGTLAVAEAMGAEVVAGPAGRGGQIARGVAAARAPWLMILHADTRLPPDWPAAVAPALRDPARAAYFRLSFDGAGAAPRLVAGWANLRARLFGLPYGDQGLLIHCDTLAAVGGVPDIALMEDVALARALAGRLTALPATVVTSAAAYRRDGWLRRGGQNLWRLTRYRAGVSPDRLARGYRR